MMKLNVSPSEFRGIFRNARETIIEIAKVTDHELTYITFDGQTVVKKIRGVTQAHEFFYGFVPVYSLDDGSKIWAYSYRTFDWRHYPLEEIEERERRGLERMMKEGIKIPKFKRTYHDPLISELKHKN